MAGKIGTERDRRRLKAARAVAGLDSHRALERRVREVNAQRGTRYKLSASSAGKIESQAQLAEEGQLLAVLDACGLADWSAIDRLIDESARASGIDPATLDAPTSPDGDATKEEVLGLLEDERADRPLDDDSQQSV